MKKRNPRYVIRVLLGLLFLISATLKLLSIDSLEIYIFSFGWFSLSVSFILARLLIAAEYVVGVLLIANLGSALAWWSATVLTLGFSVFLGYLLIIGNSDNCHCFGDLIDLNPAESLYKNAVLFFLLLISKEVESFKYRLRNLWFFTIVSGAIAAVFIISPPDNWRYDGYSLSTTVNEAAFADALVANDIPSSIMTGDKIICFYSLKCEFCKMSAQKIATLRKRGEFSQAPVIVLFGRGKTEDDTAPFFDQTGLQAQETHFIDPSVFLRITNGEMPLTLVMHEGSITAKYSFRDLH